MIYGVSGYLCFWSIQFTLIIRVLQFIGVKVWYQ